MSYRLFRSAPVLVGALLFATLAAAAGRTQFDHANSGLSLSYPDDWRTLSRAEIEEAARAGGEEPVDEEAMSVMLDNMALSVVKDFPSGGNVNLMVMSVPMSAEECAVVDGAGWEEDDAKDYIGSDPTGKRVEHTAKISGLRGYSAEFRYPDRTAVQHRYWWCSGTHGVLLQTTSSSPDTEAAALAVLATVKISRH
jgi:hypothetical protein